MESPANVAAIIADAMNKIKTGHSAEAITALKQAAAANPNDPQVHTCLGVAYTNQGDTTAAVTAFEQALALQESPRAYYNVGLAYESVFRAEEALHSYTKALSLDPNYAAARQAIDRLTPAPAPAAPVIEPTAVVQGVVSAPEPTVMGEPPVMPPPHAILGETPDFNAIFATPTAPPDLARENYEKEQRFAQQRKDYIKSAIIYGASCGAGFLLLVRMLPLFLEGASGTSGGEMALLIFGTLIQGAIMGAIVGYWIGHTCGEDIQGLAAGAVMGAVYGLASGLLNGQGAMALFGMLYSALCGGIFGFIVGKWVESSIGWN